ncbi:MAG: hypothetical protein SynsKO_16070 [Synoicihabitans sp.]
MVVLGMLSIATGDVIEVDPPSTHFDRSIQVSTGADGLTGRPHFPFVGENLHLSIRTEPGDQVSWRFNGEDLPGVSGSLFSIFNLTAAHTGNYQCVITRKGVRVASETITINVVSRPQDSLIDETFQAAPLAGLEAMPLAIRPDGWIAVRYLNASLYQRAWWWVSPDGTQAEEIYSITGPLNTQGIVKFFADGSYLLREQDAFTYVQSDGTSAAVIHPDGMLANASYTLPTPDGGWIIGDSIDVTAINSSGDTIFQKNVSDFGVLTISELVEIPDSNGRFFLIGSVGDTPETYGRVAMLIEPTGDIVSGFEQISIDRFAPTRLPDQTLAHCENGVLRRFDPQGNLTSTRQLPELVLADAVAFSPDGWLYATYRGAGMLRFDLQGERDLNFAVYFPDDITSFTPTIVFDDLNRPLLGIKPDQHESLLGASNLVRIKNATSVLGAPPVPVVDPNATPQAGDAWSMDASAVGSGPIDYQWMRLDRPDGAPLPEGPRLQIDSIDSDDLGIYQLRVTSPFGSTLSPVQDLRPKLRPRLSNLSGRGSIGNTSPLVAGFVIDYWRRAETHPSRSSGKILLRGVGPTLADFGVQTPAADPHLVFENKQDGSTSTNDNWSPLGAHDDLLRVAQGIFPLKENSTDAQLLLSAGKGIYLSHVQTSSNSSGVALAEIHSMDLWNENELTNLSLRGEVGTGEDVLIGGFVIQDPEHFDRPLRVLVRAVGPTLADYGVAHACADPKLTLFDGDGQVLASNEDWADTDAAAIAEMAQTLGAFDLPSNSKDAAIIIELPPGAFTAHVSCESGDGGQALFEIYRIPPD